MAWRHTGLNVFRVLAGFYLPHISELCWRESSSVKKASPSGVNCPSTDLDYFYIFQSNYLEIIFFILKDKFHIG